MVGKTASRSARGVDLTDLLASFTLSLRAANKAPRTIETYCDSLVQLIDFLISSGLSTDATKLTRGLLGSTTGSSFEQMRDAALLRLFIDTGIRASEGINLRVEDIDLTSRMQTDPGVAMLRGDLRIFTTRPDATIDRPVVDTIVSLLRPGCGPKSQVDDLVDRQSEDLFPSGFRRGH